MQKLTQLMYLTHIEHEVKLQICQYLHFIIIETAKLFSVIHYNNSATRI